MPKKLIQIGIFVRRDPETGEFLKAMPIYEEETPKLRQAEEHLHDEVAKLFAAKIKQYVDGVSAQT